MKTARLLVVFIVMVGLIGGCSSLNRQQQRILSGGAIGAGTGAALGAIAGHGILAGAVIGAAAGAVGGYVYDQATSRSK